MQSLKLLPLIFFMGCGHLVAEAQGLIVHKSKVHAPRVLLQSDEFDFPPPDELGDDLDTWATNYYVPQIKGILTGPWALLDMAGNELGPKLTEDDWCKAAFEGTVRVVDDFGYGKTYNFDSTADVDEVKCKGGYQSFPDTNKARFKIAHSDFGNGTRDWLLVPYRTIAVAPSEIPFGSVVYIPDARGQKFTLPDGETRVHDGYFYAADTGGAMKKHSTKPGWEYHIDVFSGIDEVTPLRIVSNKPTVRMHAYIVDDVDIAANLDDMHHSPSVFGKVRPR